MEMAVNAAVDSGVHFAIAAGNEDEDACLSSPAGAEKVLRSVLRHLVMIEHSFRTGAHVLMCLLPV